MFLLAAVASSTIAMNQMFHIGGFDYALSSIHWLSKTDPKAAHAMSEPGCQVTGNNGILAFTFHVKSENAGEGAVGDMAIVPTYKNGAQPQAFINVGGEPTAYVYAVCDAPKPTKANPITKVRFGNGNNESGYPKYYYLKNPAVTI